MPETEAIKQTNFLNSFIFHRIFIIPILENKNPFRVAKYVRVVF